MVTEQFVRDQFSCWETRIPIPFFDSLPESFTWTVAGAINPLRGVYRSKESALAAFGQKTSKMTVPPVCKIFNVMVSGDSAVVEMAGKTTSKAGKDYDEMACFILRYDGEGKVAEIRLYIDTAVEKEILEETEGMS
jgi:ketosteroid isomerase-like protein